MVVALVAAVMVVGGVVYHRGHQPKGDVASGVSAGPECALDESTLARTRTHNFEHGGTYEPGGGGSGVAERNVNCEWGQVRGVDGIDERELVVHVGIFGGADGVERARRNYADTKVPPYLISDAEVIDVAGIGDEASFALRKNRSISEVRILVRKGNVVVSAGLRGKKQGAFRSTAMSYSEGRPIAELVARDLLRRHT
ncbi:hypothetical protein [Nocardia blacklockiae]|uniref:hypothetical protein n=1 Tax=Nocardia blacklockiae TaxID=480036 RepID=UPI0018955574|nr:hypothetical protein [Nocardia blacklockiae]MBF6174028.1 hypothetical protein [Nocardia blacklockiae]